MTNTKGPGKQVAFFGQPLSRCLFSLTAEGAENAEARLLSGRAAFGAIVSRSHGATGRPQRGTKVTTNTKATLSLVVLVVSFVFVVLNASAISAVRVWNPLYWLGALGDLRGKSSWGQPQTPQGTSLNSATER